MSPNLTALYLYFLASVGLYPGLSSNPTSSTGPPPSIAAPTPTLFVTMWITWRGCREKESLPGVLLCEGWVPQSPGLQQKQKSETGLHKIYMCTTGPGSGTSQDRAGAAHGCVHIRPQQPLSLASPGTLSSESLDSYPKLLLSLSSFLNTPSSTGGQFVLILCREMAGSLQNSIQSFQLP